MAKPNIYTKIIGGLIIFQTYSDRHTVNVAGEHDTLYAGPSPEIVSKEHLEKLEEYGWSQDEEYDCFYKFI